MQREAERFARRLQWDLRGRRLVMTDCWMNVMPANTYHTLHLHPHSVLSGTYYVQTPPGSVALKLEDPRMPMYMNAPVRVGTGSTRCITPSNRKPGISSCSKAGLGTKCRRTDRGGHE